MSGAFFSLGNCRLLGGNFPTGEDPECQRPLVLEKNLVSKPSTLNSHVSLFQGVVPAQRLIRLARAAPPLVFQVSPPRPSAGPGLVAAPPMEAVFVVHRQSPRRYELFRG